MKPIKNESGSLVLPFIIVLVIALSATGFGIWAFLSRQDYKNNSDKKSAVAVQKAVAAEDIKKDAQHAEDDKKPYKTYTGPATYGGVELTYPKTYNAYIADKANGNLLAKAYFNPNFVPEVSTKTSYALRIEIKDTDYATVLKVFSGLIKKGTITASAYRAPKVPSVLGTILTGEVSNGFQGTMVILPIRDKTLSIWTEDPKYRDDLNNTLASLTFSP